MFAWARRGVCSPEGLLRALATLILCCISIRLFCYDISIPVFCSKIILPLSHLVVYMASPIPPLIGSRIFCCWFRTSLFVYIVRSFLGIFLVFLLSLVFLVGLLKHFLCSSCQAFSVSSENIFMFRFSITACCRNVFICDSSLSSNPGFDFQPMVFKGTHIFPQTNFAPAYIKSFNFEVSFVGIFGNKPFTFLVLDLTVLQSEILREGNVVFFSDKILLMVSTLVSSSWISVFAVHRSLSCSFW